MTEIYLEKEGHILPRQTSVISAFLSEAIPLILSRGDLLAQTATGTGK